MRRDELPLPETDPSEVREAADEILSRVQFRRPPPSLFDRAEDAVSEAMGRALESLLGSGAGTALAWLVLASSVGLAMFFLTRFGRTVTADRAIDGVPEMIELTRSPAEWRSVAAEHEQAGRWKEGLLARYRALVGQLVLDGVLDDVPGRTTGEYRREVAERRAELAEAFGEASALFERAWYGDEPTGSPERDLFVSHDLQVTGSRR